MGFEFLSTRTEPVGIGAVNWLTEALIRVKVYDYGTSMNIDSYLSTIRNKIKSAQTSFYHFQLVYVSEMGPVVSHSESTPDGKMIQVYERYIDCRARFAFES
jgi:hypothetical protein